MLYLRRRGRSRGPRFSGRPRGEDIDISVGGRPRGEDIDISVSGRPRGVDIGIRKSMAETSRTRLAARNIGMNLIYRVTEQLLRFVVRTIFIRMLAVDYLGINGLFTNILSVLSLAELGVGSSIVYLMYRPIALGDSEQVRAYMNAYKRLYSVIGMIILVVGLALTPFLNFFILEPPDIKESLYLIYVLYIIKTCSTYFFSYKQSIFTANQQGYIVTRNTLLFSSLTSLLEIVFLLLTHEYMAYLLVAVIVTYAQNINIARLADRAYPFIAGRGSERIAPGEQAAITRNVKALMLHKVSGTIINSSDTLIISKFLGITVLGIYSNYLAIISMEKNLLSSVFDAMTASVGNLCAQDDPDRDYSVFSGIQMANLWLTGVCTIALAVLLNPFILLWAGESFLLPMSTVWIIVCSYYLQTAVNVVGIFRSANGLFYNDRYVPFAQCIINVAISVALVGRLGLKGIFIGTIISNLLTVFWVQPYMVFKHVLRRPLRLYFVSYVRGAVTTLLALAATYMASRLVTGSGVVAFLERGVLCALIPNLIFLAVYCRSPEFHFMLDKCLRLIGRRE